MVRQGHAVNDALTLGVRPLPGKERARLGADPFLRAVEQPAVPPVRYWWLALLASSVGGWAVLIRCAGLLIHLLT